MKRLGALLVALTTLACGSGDGGSVTDAGAGETGATAFSDRVSLSEVATFQTVKVDLMKDGSDIAKLNAPIVSYRPTLLRAYVTVSGQWSKPLLVDAELDLFIDGKPAGALFDSKPVSESSIDGDLATTFNFDLHDGQVRSSTTFTLSIRNDATGEAITYPSDGSARTLGVRDGAPVRVEMVPIQYDTDGSHRLPSLDATQLARFHDTLYRMYPSASVDVSVHAPLAWNQSVAPDGTGWDELLGAVAGLRQADVPPDDVYYVAAFEPAPTINDFCSQGGCVLGVAPVAGPDDVDLRVAMVLGYKGQYPANTLNQELAHAMGREHADCGGADYIDPKFPYPDAGIGMWGYDILDKTLVDPNTVFDFMGYCSPIWVSDYTYSGLFDRIVHVAQGLPPSGPVAPAPPQNYRLVHLRPDGSLAWGRVLPMRRAPSLETRAITLLGAGRTVEVPFVRFDHVGGGILFLREEEARMGVRVEGAGRLAPPSP
ncbi:MAG TPA: hypothetical protein VLM85_01855 [Polyangiaceae bacterium]|nr:hypothetical protein [Polyangiaceae bacterium]